MKKITFVIGDDWEGLYADGKCIEQGHRVSVYDALIALGFEVNKKEADQVWLEEQGQFPQNETEVKFL